jgi:nucleoside-diphosphate-sugar epimerase
MRVFVTGASGFVGSAVVRDLVAAGYSVLGLARSEASAAAVAAAGADVHRGSVEDPESLRAGAAQADGVIHTAFIHDFSKFKENCEIDRRAIGALASALEGSGRPLVVTSGTGLLSTGRPSTEEDAAPAESANPRIASEEAAAASAARGVHVAIVRLPPSVHGEGDHGFVPMLIDVARRKGVSAYIGDGQNRWAGVHRFDAAPVYRLALEKGAAFARYHAVAEGSIPFKDIAEAIGRGLNIPVRRLTHDEAAGHFGWFAHFAELDSPTLSERTRAALGWQPEGAELIADIQQAGYFDA